MNNAIGLPALKAEGLYLNAKVLIIQMLPTNKKQYDKICHECKQPFVTYDRRQKYCHLFCRNRANNRRFWSKHKIVTA